MVRLYLPDNHVEAQLLLDLLLSANIDVVLKGGFLTGAAGELPPSDVLSLWLLEPAQQHEAEKILADFEARKSFTAKTQECESCGETVEGNFDCCWNCGAALPEVIKKI